MSFQVPLSTGIGIETPSLGQKASDLRNVLEIGNKLNVVVSGNEQTGKGVLIGGNFHRAELPNGYKAGDALSVMVTDNRDAVVLKILSGKSQSIGPAALYENVIRTVLPPESLEALRKAKQIPSLTKTEPKLTSQSSLIESLLERLSGLQVLNSSKGIQSAENFMNVLKSVLDNSKLRNASRLSHSLHQQSNGDQALEKLFENLSSFFGGQEALNTLNPFMAKLGQPALILIPTLLDGLLSRWEISVLNDHTDEVAEDDKKARNSKGYRRIKLSAQFPSIGKVIIDIAYDDNEVLLKLIFQQPDIAEYISGLLPNLEKSLQNLGFKKFMLRAEAGQEEIVIPSWYCDLSRIYRNL